MIPGEWDAQRAVAAAPLLRFEGTVWRTHWKELNATDWSRSLETSGRYNRGRDLYPDDAWPALYTSLDAETAVWEMVRRSLTRNPRFLTNQVLSEIAVGPIEVLDARDPVALNLTLADLTGTTMTITQDLAQAASGHGYQGLLVPSAAILGRHNLTILPANLSELSALRVVSSVDLHLE